jgi:hypothetical protein
MPHKIELKDLAQGKQYARVQCFGPTNGAEITQLMEQLETYKLPTLTVVEATYKLDPDARRLAKERLEKVNLGLPNATVVTNPLARAMTKFYFMVMPPTGTRLFGNEQEAVAWLQERSTA